MEPNGPIFLLFFFHCFILFLGSTSSMASAMPTLSETTENGENPVMAASVDPTTLESAESSSLRRYLSWYNPRAAITCNRYPKVCYARGSPGRYCCKKSCVDLMKDYRNCGRCGRRCRYGEACCHGRCVNIMFDRKNCGRCQRTCKKRSRCRYGMCSYAY